MKIVIEVEIPDAILNDYADDDSPQIDTVESIAWGIAHDIDSVDGRVVTVVSPQLPGGCYYASIKGWADDAPDVRLWCYRHELYAPKGQCPGA